MSGRARWFVAGFVAGFAVATLTVLVGFVAAVT
jgi:hypothetical protein